MRRRSFCLLALTASLIAAAQSATLEVNAATQAQLESLPGVGPALAERILVARKKRLFEDWVDLRKRVRGLGEKLAQTLSAAGLRVQGKALAEPMV